jgi:hypothetical protein
MSPIAWSTHSGCVEGSRRWLHSLTATSIGPSIQEAAELQPEA